MTTGTVQTEEKKPSPERFSTGKLKPPKAKIENDSSAPPPETRRGCHVCGEPGGPFASLRDSQDVVRTVHIPQHSLNGEAIKSPDCEKVFLSQVKADTLRVLQEEKQDLALEALRREGNAPRLEHSSQRHFDCPAPDCSRFFDSQNGVDLHRRRQHKGAA